MQWPALGGFGQGLFAADAVVRYASKNQMHSPPCTLPAVCVEQTLSAHERLTATCHVTGSDITYTMPRVDAERKLMSSVGGGMLFCTQGGGQRSVVTHQPACGML